MQPEMGPDRPELDESEIAQRAPPGRRSVVRLRSITVLAGLLIVLTTACGNGDRGPDGVEWQARIDTIGDTVVVRTLAGSEWGPAALVPELRIGVLEGEEHEMFGSLAGLAVDPEGRIHVYDWQATALRRFGPDGAYLGTLGRSGEGPGEYRQSDGGLAVLADGRIVLRDPGNGRFTVWSSGGEFLEHWQGPARSFTQSPLVASRDGGFYSPVFGGGQPMRIVRHGPDGVPGDTLLPPDRGVVPPVLAARGENISYSFTVPFSPRAVWAFHPDGHYVSAVSDRYAVDLLRSGGPVLRIEMTRAERVPVARGERTSEEERIRSRMREADPSWRWDGPSIPETKPLIQGLHAGEDGRIWVQLHQPGEPDPHQDLEPGPDGERLLPRFVEPVVFDVFEPDGRYLGRLSAPDGLSTFPRPVFRGDHVWATVTDEMGVEYVVRYRIERDAGR